MYGAYHVDETHGPMGHTMYQGCFRCQGRTQPFLGDRAVLRRRGGHHGGAMGGEPWGWGAMEWGGRWVLPLLSYGISRLRRETRPRRRQGRGYHVAMHVCAAMHVRAGT